MRRFCAEIYFFISLQRNSSAYNKTIGQLFDDIFLKSQFLDYVEKLFRLATFCIGVKQDRYNFRLNKSENMPYEMTSAMHEDHKRNEKLELQMALEVSL